MKRALVFFALIVTFIVITAFFESRKVSVSGESTTLDDGFVMAEIGYSQGGRTVLYAVFRSFPTNSTPAERTHDGRYEETASGVLVRDDNGRMVPVGRDGMIYFFTGDHLRKMKVRANEDDIGIGRCRNTDEVWESLKRFELHENSK